VVEVASPSVREGDLTTSRASDFVTGSRFVSMLVIRFDDRQPNLTEDTPEESKAESREFNRHTTDLAYLHMCIDTSVSVAKSDSARRLHAIRVG
jgi:hypothetical protein